MINLPQTEQLVNALVKKNIDQNSFEGNPKSGWKNYSFTPQIYSASDLKITMRKDLNHHTNQCYKWFRNLIIPKINVILKSNTESITTGTGFQKNFQNISAIFSCYKYTENSQFNVQQVPMKGQVVQLFTLNKKQKSKKKFNQLQLLQTNSKNLQFTQSHIQNRKIYYCLSITICKMDGNQVDQEYSTSLLMPILVENRKKSLQNRTNKYMKFIEFLPIEFQRPLILPQQESKDDIIFKYCIENHIKNEELRILSDDSWKNSSSQDNHLNQSPFNNFGSYHLQDGLNSSSIEVENNEGQQIKNKFNIDEKMIREMQKIDDEILLSDDLISALIYLSSKTIRHKIFHPFFLSNRFSSAFELKIRKSLITSSDTQKSLVQMQEILLNSVFFPKQIEKSANELSFKNQPICLLIKPKFNKQSLDTIFFHKISSQIVNYLDCIQTKDGLFVGFQEQIDDIKNYETVNFLFNDYTTCYDQLSRIPINLQQNKDASSQKKNYMHYEIKICPTIKDLKNCEESGINIYRTIINCKINSDASRKKLKKVRLTGNILPITDQDKKNRFQEILYLSTGEQFCNDLNNEQTNDELFEGYAMQQIGINQQRKSFKDNDSNSILIEKQNINYNNQSINSNQQKQQSPKNQQSQQDQQSTSSSQHSNQNVNQSQVMNLNKQSSTSPSKLDASKLKDSSSQNKPTELEQESQNDKMIQEQPQLNNYTISTPLNNKDTIISNNQISPKIPEQKEHTISEFKTLNNATDNYSTNNYQNMNNINQGLYNHQYQVYGQNYYPNQNTQYNQQFQYPYMMNQMNQMGQNSQTYYNPYQNQYQNYGNFMNQGQMMSQYQQQFTQQQPQLQQNNQQNQQDQQCSQQEQQQQQQQNKPSKDQEFVGYITIPIFTQKQQQQQQTENKISSE